MAEISGGEVIARMLQKGSGGGEVVGLDAHRSPRALRALASRLWSAQPTGRAGPRRAGLE